VTAGAMQVMELELIEPSLFLDVHPDAPARLARAILTANGARTAIRTEAGSTD
jgi:hypothetical protein